MSNTAVHEASHAAAALMLGRRVEHVLVEPGLTGDAWVGEQLGYCKIPIGNRLDAGQVVLCLVGYLADRTRGWPPSYQDALDENREALGTVMLMLGVTEEVYDDLVKLTHELLDDPTFQRVQNSIARALSHSPRLEATDIETLARIHLPDLGEV